VEAPNGYCAPSSGGAFICGCKYGCTSDAECQPSQICLCGPNIGTCVAASCTKDADCGGGATCMEYENGGGCSSVFGFACSSPLDECVSNADCAGSQGGFGQKVCGHDGQKRLCVDGPQACP
jgi:hypothetical protein